MRFPRVSVRRISALPGVLLTAAGLLAFPAPAGADTAGVVGSAIGYFADDISLFGGSQPDTGPTPAVELTSNGSNSPQTASAPSGTVVYGPAYLFTSDQITLDTSGTTGTNGSVTTTASLTNVNKATTQPTTTGSEILTADNITSSCTSSKSGSTRSTSLLNGKLWIDSGLDNNADDDYTDPGEHAPVEIALPDNPAPNTVFTGHIHLNASEQDDWRVVLNEHVTYPDGSVVVNAVHEYFGTAPPDVLVGHMILGQSRCGRAVTPSIGITDTSVVEGDSGTTTATFTVSLSEPSSQTVTVRWRTVNGTAVAPGDFTAVPTTTLTFSPGQTSKTVSATVVGDPRREGNETFRALLSSPTNATLADTSGTAIVIDEEGPSWAYVSNIGVIEGNSGTTVANFAVTVSPAPTQTVTLKVATANGTATAASGDYTAVPSTVLTFLAGETSKVVSVPVNGDATAEPDETFLLNLTTPTGGLALADTSGTATIQNDDGTVPAALPPSVGITDTSVVEGNSGTTTASFNVSLSAASAQTVTVRWRTVNGTALAPGDYTAVPTTTLTFSPGQTSKTVSATVVGDTLREGNETFRALLSSPVNATLADTSGTATITDEEGPSWAYVSDLGVAEGDTGTTAANFAVTVSPAPTQTVTLKVVTANGTATAAGGDYTAVPSTIVTFLAGETSKVVSVPVNGDATVEPDETFLLNLTAPTGGLVLADTSGTATVQNDD